LAADDRSVYKTLWSRGERLRVGIKDALQDAGHTIVTAGGGPVFHVSFMQDPAHNYRETLAANAQLYSDFALSLLDEGILVLPDGRWYLSTAHSEQDIDSTLAAVTRALS
jgi:glutamate-1-semialdehyde 2,1-aminomutase